MWSILDHRRKGEREMKVSFRLLGAAAIGVMMTGAALAQTGPGQPEVFGSTDQTACPGPAYTQLYNRQIQMGNNMPPAARAAHDANVNKWFGRVKANCGNQQAETRGLDQRQNSAVNSRYDRINHSLGVQMGNAYARGAGVPEYKAGPPIPNAGSLSMQTPPQSKRVYSNGYKKVPAGSIPNAGRYGGYNHAIRHPANRYAQRPNLRQRRYTHGGYKHVPAGYFRKPRSQR